MIKFDTRYKVYLDVTANLEWDWNEDSLATWVQVYPDSGSFEKKIVKDELFTRFEWNEITFRNDPVRSIETYNIIHDLPVDQEIRIKVVLPSSMIDPDVIDPNSTATIRGYFGTNDCRFDHDKNTKTLRVVPTVLDAYTNVLENWEKEVDLIVKEEHKATTWAVVQDVDIISESRNMPIRLMTTDMNEPRTPTAGDGETPIYSFFLNSENLYSTVFSLYMSGSVELENNATIGVYLNVYNGSGVLLNEGADVGYGLNLYKFTNETGASAIFNISTTTTGSPALPIGCYAILYLYLSEESDTTFSAIDLSLDADTESLTTTDIDVNIMPTYLRTFTVWNEMVYGYTNPRDDEFLPLTQYFEITGEPKNTLLTDNGFAPHSTARNIYPWINQSNAPINIHGQFLTDITQSMATCSDGFSSGYELSEVTLYKDIGTNGQGLFGLLRHRFLFATCKYSRFEAWMPNATIPPVEDAGWVAHPSITKEGKVLWTNLPYSGTTGWSLGSLITEDGEAAGFGYSQRITSKRSYPSADTSVAAPSRSLYNVLKTIFNGTHSSLINKDVISCFFFNDSDSVITTNAGMNYFLEIVTPDRASNFLNNIYCAHTYQFQTPSEDSEDSELKVSLKTILDELRKLFNYQIFWFINSNGNLQIEHLYYHDIGRSAFLDLTAGADDPTDYNLNIHLLDEIQRWEYDKSKMFSLIEFDVENARYKDFTDNKITFKKIVSNKRNEDIKQTHNIRLLTTDLRYCVEYPEDLSNGLVLINTDGSGNSVSAWVPLANTDWENGNIALSNLLYRFAYEGVFTEGKINGIHKNFAVTVRSKRGDTITIKGIYNYDFYKTIIGMGMIESVDYDIDRETTVLTILYRFGSSANTDSGLDLKSADIETDLFRLMVSIKGDFEGATSILYDFGEA